MDYSEFLEKSGMYVTIEEYEQIVNPIYLKSPADIVGSKPEEFYEWVKDNGFTLEQLRQIARIAETYDSVLSESVALEQKVFELDAKAGVLESQNRKLQDRLDAAIEVAGDESLVRTIVDNMSTEDIIDAWVRTRDTRRQ